MPTTVLTIFLNQVLPVIALSLWCAIYVVYCWRDPDIRRWLERQTFQLTARRRSTAAPKTAPFRPPAAPVVRPPAPPMVAVRGSASTALAAPRPADRLANLPLRHRLLGQVRPASNDN